ncbi:MAG: magnesium protoporphyrin IX methyltransferase [Pseudomonadota bacterium]
MRPSSYLQRRDQLTTYFDQTAAAAWQALTSNAPVSRVRATVRAGRDDMRSTLLDWLPADLTGKTLLDAGCGTGALAVDAARRGASVIAIDVASNLVNVARERAAEEEFSGEIDFRVGDMLADAPAKVDHIVAMDSLIHYAAVDVHKVVAEFAGRARSSVHFTAAPWTMSLAMMHFVGRQLARSSSNRAPAIEPVRIGRLMDHLDASLADEGWVIGRSERIKSGFYISHALELIHR